MRQSRGNRLGSSARRLVGVGFRYGHPTAYCLLLTSCVLLLTGCVHRSLTIRTDPPGALVYINDELKGKTPLTYDFLWYGWHRVLIRKDGYDRVEDHQLIRAPIYAWIPFDLVAEAMPFRIRDDRAWSYVLVPSVPLPTPTPPPLQAPPAPKPPKHAPAASTATPVITPSGATDKPAATPSIASGVPASSATGTTPAENASPASSTEPAATPPSTTETTHDTR